MENERGQSLLARYEELVSLHLSDRQRLQEIFAHQTSAILALDGLRPDVGHEVLWVLRESASGEIFADGHPPLTASGLKLHERLTLIATSLERVAKKGTSQRNWSAYTAFSERD